MVSPGHTASSLYIILQEAYTKYVNGLEDGRNQMSLEDWCNSRCDANLQYKCWPIKLQLKVPISVRSIGKQTSFAMLIFDQDSALVLCTG